MPDPTTTAATECGYCEGHGYTTGSGKLVECPECNGVGSVPTTAAPWFPRFITSSGPLLVRCWVCGMTGSEGNVHVHF